MRNTKLIATALITATAAPIAHARLDILATQADAPPTGPGTYSQFHNPLINENGDIAFEATLTGTGVSSANDTAIYTYNPTAGFEQVAREADDVFGGTAGSQGFFGSLRNADTRFNEAMDVAFIANDLTSTPGGTADNAGVYVSDRPLFGGSPTPTERQRKGDPTSTVGDYQQFYNLAMNQDGDLAMAVLLDGAGITTNNDTAIIRDRIFSTAIVAHEGSSPLGITGDYDDFSLSGVFSQPSINNLETIAIRARFRGASTAEAILTFSATSTFERLRVGDPAANGNGTITSFDVISINRGTVLHPNETQVAEAIGYTGTTGGSGDNRGIETVFINTPIQTARTPQIAPDGDGNLSYFRTPRGIANGGKILTTATIDGTADTSADSGIYIISPTEIREVARERDPAPDGRGTFPELLNNEMNFSENGLALFHSFIGAETGLYISDGIDLITVARTIAFSSDTGDITQMYLAPRINRGGQKQVNQNGQVAVNLTIDGTGDALTIFTPDLHWRNTNTTGNYDDQNNWTLGIQPANDVHDVTIDPDTPVNIASPLNNINPNTLTVGGGLGMATLNIDAITVDPTNPLAVNRNGHLRIDNAATLDANNINLGNTPALPTDDPATLSISGPGTTLNNGSQFNVGTNAPATVNVTNHANAIIGTLHLGNSNHGTFNILNGATANADDLATFGNNPGSSGTLNIDGLGSTFHFTSEAFIGLNGAGHINVTNQATLDADELIFATNTGSTASLNVAGPGTTATGPTFTFGGFGHTDVTIQDNASLTATGSTIFADRGSTTATIQSGATVNLNTAQIGRATDSHSHVTVTGPDTSMTANSVEIAGSGTAHLTIANAATATATSTLIADGGDANGTLTVTGPGATYTTGSLQASADGHATIHVEQGGTLNINANVTAAEFTGSTANITTTDPGSSIHITGTLDLGDAGGTATANVLNQGQLNVTDAINLNGQTINVNGGTLTTHNISGLGTVNFPAGNINLTTPSEFVLGAHQFDPNLTLTDDHTITAANFLTTDTNMDLTIDGGSITAAIYNSSGRLTISRGTIAATTGFKNFDDLELGSATTAKIQTPEFINSGNLSGTGRITGNVNNSSNGRITIAGQTLRIDGTFFNNAGPGGGLVIGNGTLQAANIQNGADMAFSSPTNIIGDVNNFTGGTIVSSGFGPLTFFDDVTNESEIRTNTGGFTVFLGTTSGSGIYTGTGTVVFESDFTPGSSPGINTFAGNLTFGPFATLEIETLATITAPVAGTDHDQLTIANTLTLDGTLSIQPLHDSGPITDTPLGNEYLAITFGSRTPNSYFHTITNSLQSTAFALAPILDDTAKTFTLRATIPGDLNLDNKVSVADLAEFALNFDTTPGLYNDATNTNSWQLGDFNTDGAITVADLSLLALNFGFDATDPTSTPTPLSLSKAATLAGIDPSTIPEPTTNLTLILAALTLSAKRHKQHTNKRAL